MNDKMINKIKNGRQYRKMILEVRDDENETFVVRGYATTFNQPYRLYEDDDIIINEQVDMNAFENTDLSDVIFQYDHEGRVFARTSNNTLSLQCDEHGLLIEADLGGTSIGRNLYEEIKGGYTNKMSFGFTVDDDTVLESSEDNKRVYLRTITRIGKLYDVSAVSLPANDMTEISARGFIDGVIDKFVTERSQKAEIEKKRKKLDLLISMMED